MGLIQTKPPNAPSSKNYLQQWQTLDHLETYNLVRNTRTHSLGHAWKYKLDPMYDPKDEMKIYGMRDTEAVPIVRTYSAEILEKVSKKGVTNRGSGGEGNGGGGTGGGICASNNHIGVVTESIPFTLADLPQLTFPESLYILHQALRGYQHLYPKSGPVHITPKMMGINDQGKVKVWINQDFSQNHPNSQIRSLLSTRNKHLDREYNLISPQYRDQKQMIQNIIDVVEDKNQIGIFPTEFHNGIRENCHNFRTARQWLQGYGVRNRVPMPNGIHERYVQVGRKEGREIRDRYEGVRDEIVRGGRVGEGQVKQLGSMPIGYIESRGSYADQFGPRNKQIYQPLQQSSIHQYPPSSNYPPPVQSNFQPQLHSQQLQLQPQPQSQPQLHYNKYSQQIPRIGFQQQQTRGPVKIKFNN